ncbi:MAG: lysophospholipid acyltransferase family protein [Flectobacillus sp.]|nr:lysophospholipid acyltransferase family protein [Flectobacillus sp.]
MKFIKQVYTLWAAFWFIFLFLLLFPLFWIFLQKESWKPAAHYLNRFWGKLYFPIIGIPVRIRYEFEPDPKQAYVFCGNHFSYLDIAVMGLVVKNYFAFVGKSDLKKIPLFGYMFRKLHIQVDRKDKNSRTKSLTRSIKALQSGRSVVIFPEGGILSKNIPQLHTSLKDGAFLMAIQEQVPLVPISFLNNYKVLFDDELLLHPQPIEIVVHQPIFTEGMTKENIEELKQHFSLTVQNTIDAYHKRKESLKNTNH